MGVLICSRCGQPFLPNVALPPTKQKILDAVRRQPGIDGENLPAAVWTGPDGGPEDRKVLHVHVYQLNRLLAPSGICVRGSKFYGYRVRATGTSSSRRMTAAEYREALAALGLSQTEAAQFFDIGERTSRRYALGESPIPGAVAILLRLMAHEKISAEVISEIAEG